MRKQATTPAIRNGRAQRLKQALIAAAGPVSVATLLKSAGKGDNTNNFMRGLIKLQEAGKVRRIDGAGIHSRWQATEGLLVDRRFSNRLSPAMLAYQAKRKAKAAAKPKPATKGRAKPTAAQQMQIRPKPPAEAPRNTPPPPVAHVRASLHGCFAYGKDLKRTGDLTSEQIADDVARFLAAGGRIQQLRTGESSESQRFEAELKAKGLKAINEASWRRKQLTENPELETEDA